MQFTCKKLSARQMQELQDWYLSCKVDSNLARKNNARVLHVDSARQLQDLAR